MKVLVVDDEKDVQSLFLQRFRKELKSNLFEMEFMLSGEEALEYLNKYGFKNKIILSDINMPGMSGLELLENIQKAATPPPPVIFMISAYGDEENKKDAERLGAADFFTKPVDFDLLKEKIQEILS